MQNTLLSIEGIEISFNGHTGSLALDNRNVLLVESKKGFAVIRRYLSRPTFADVQATLVRKGIL